MEFALLINNQDDQKCAMSNFSQKKKKIEFTRNILVNFRILLSQHPVHTGSLWSVALLFDDKYHENDLYQMSLKKSQIQLVHRIPHYQS